MPVFEINSMIAQLAENQQRMSCLRRSMIKVTNSDLRAHVEATIERLYQESLALSQQIQTGLAN